MKKNRIFTSILAMALVLIAVIVVVITVGLFRTSKEETLEGQAETTDYRLSSKVPARVLEIRVKEGDFVRKGDTLVVLEAPDVEAKLSQANAAYDAARAMEEKAHNGARQEDIQAAYEMWQKSKAAVDVTEKTYNRVQRLFESGVMAEQKRDEAKAQYDAAVATEKAAKAKYDTKRRQEHGAGAGRTCQGSHRRSELVHKGDSTYCYCRRTDNGDIPRSGRACRHRRSYHERICCERRVVHI